VVLLIGLAPENIVHAIAHRLIHSNDIHLHIAECGSGPLVVMCHGFPGLWYSWRHQLPALAAAGFHAVAIDQRGYGRSDRPIDPSLYDMNYAMGDLLAVLDALGEQRAVFIGHDFGSPQVWNLAVRHPDRVAAVVSLSVAYDFDLAGRGGAGSKPLPDSPAFSSATIKPTELFARIAQQHFFHMHYFQTIGPAEKELGANVRLFLTRLFWALGSEGRLLDWSKYPSQGTGYLDVLEDPPIPLPWPWMSKEDMDYCVAEYERSGPELAFIGGLNSYRVADRNWELGAPYADAKVQQPALYIAGAQDPVLKLTRPDAIDIMRSNVPNLRDAIIIPNAGHFVQQEQPEATNRALLKFLHSLNLK